MGSLHVPHLFKNMPVGWLGESKLLLGVPECVNGCVVPCGGLGVLVQDVFPHHTQCTWDELRLYRDPDLDYVLTFD